MAGVAVRTRISAHRLKRGLPRKLAWTSARTAPGWNEPAYGPADGALVGHSFRSQTPVILLSHKGKRTGTSPTASIGASLVDVVEPSEASDGADVLLAVPGVQRDMSTGSVDQGRA